MDGQKIRYRTVAYSIHELPVSSAKPSVMFPADYPCDYRKVQRILCHSMDQVIRGRRPRI